MSVYRYKSILVVGLIALSVLANAQSVQDSSFISGNRILLSMTQRSGWSNLPSDVTVVGQVRDANASPQYASTFTLTARGWDQVRYDVALEGTAASTVINGRKAAKLSDGKSKRLPMAFAVSSKVPILPFFSAITRPNSIETANYLRTETIGIEVTDVVEILPKCDPDDPSYEFRTKVERLTLWISRNSGLLLQVAYVRLGFNPDLQLHYLRRYSGYQSVGGLLVPMHQEEFLEGRLDVVLDLVSVNFNSGISDSTFYVPSVQ